MKNSRRRITKIGFKTSTLLEQAERIEVENAIIVVDRFDKSFVEINDRNKFIDFVANNLLEDISGVMISYTQDMYNNTIVNNIITDSHQPIKSFVNGLPVWSKTNKLITKRNHEQTVSKVGHSLSSLHAPYLLNDLELSVSNPTLDIDNTNQAPAIFKRAFKNKPWIFNLVCPNKMEETYYFGVNNFTRSSCSQTHDQIQLATLGKYKNAPHQNSNGKNKLNNYGYTYRSQLLRCTDAIPPISNYPYIGGITPPQSAVAKTTEQWFCLVQPQEYSQSNVPDYFFANHRWYPLNRCIYLVADNVTNIYGGWIAAMNMQIMPPLGTINKYRAGDWLNKSYSGYVGQEKSPRLSKFVGASSSRSIAFKPNYVPIPGAGQATSYVPPKFRGAFYRRPGFTYADCDWICLQNSALNCLYDEGINELDTITTYSGHWGHTCQNNASDLAVDAYYGQLWFAMDESFGAKYRGVNSIWLQPDIIIDNDNYYSVFTNSRRSTVYRI